LPAMYAAWFRVRKETPAPQMGRTTLEQVGLVS